MLAPPRGALFFLFNLFRLNCIIQYICVFLQNKPSFLFPSFPLQVLCFELGHLLFCSSSSSSGSSGSNSSATLSYAFAVHCFHCLVLLDFAIFSGFRGQLLCLTRFRGPLPYLTRFYTRSTKERRIGKFFPKIGDGEIRTANLPCRGVALQTARPPQHPNFRSFFLVAGINFVTTILIGTTNSDQKS